MDTTRGLTASRAPKLDWRLALARRELPCKIVCDSGTSDTFLFGIQNFKSSEICRFKNSNLKRSSHPRFFIFLVVKFLLKTLDRQVLKHI